MEVYRAELLTVTDKRVYVEAVGLLRRMERLSEELGTVDEFVSFAQGVRAANARRPSFLALFDGARLLSGREPGRAG